MTAASRARAIAYVSVIVGFLLIVNAGVKPDLGILRALLAAPGVVLILVGLYDRWLWRLGPLGTPVLHGTWHGSLTSSWRDPDQQEKSPEPIEVFVVFRQTATSLSMTLLSAESRSRSVGSWISRSPDGQYEMAWAYRNEPLKADAPRSHSHYGGGIVSGISRRPERLDGRYWTDRGTAGDFILGSRLGVLADNYTHAREMYGKHG
jgi:predicted pore-forming effector associated with SMODS systems